MSNELLDLYSEANEPLGTNKDRGSIHTDGDWHRTVHIYVKNDKGQFLVHLRSPQKDGNANCWDTRFGGHVASGDDYDTTVVREIQEEIGITASLDDFRKGELVSYNGDWNKEHTQIYFYIFNGDINDLKFNDNEVVKVQWMSPEEIIESMTTDPKRWAGSAEGFKKHVTTI